VAAFALIALSSTATLAAEKGELGGDLSILKKFYTPAAPGQSNYHIDMWDGGRIRSLAIHAGLTNNRALFINSHGKAQRHRANFVYGYYPHLSQGNQDQVYSAKDFAGLLGSASNEIHNVLVAGCDNDRAFDASELRRYFPNATNITHVAAGEAGYQPMFIQAVLSPSQSIEPLYETASSTPQGGTQYQLSASPSPRAKKLTPYLAELYKPKARKPFRTQVAGRELLDPPPATPSFTARR
jgi:hypothetical protein